MINYEKVEVIYILTVSSGKYSIEELQELFLTTSKEVTYKGSKSKHGNKISKENSIKFEARSYDYVNLEESLDGLLKNINVLKLAKFSDIEIATDLYIPTYSKYSNPGIWIKKEHVSILSQIGAEIGFDVFQMN